MRSLVALACVVACIAGTSGVSVSYAGSPAADAGIAWQVASSDAEVNRAFEVARKSGKPLFLYWGAVWCPPCNQVKATLFSRADFIERSRSFVPVYVDGDKPGAQKVASRFNVSGYPTMVLLKADGTEITRLPGEVDPEQYLMTLSAALGSQFPVKELVDRALAGRSLSTEQWQLLAFYSWDTDDQQIFRSADVGNRLSALAGFAPDTAVADRLRLKAAAARAQEGQDAQRHVDEAMRTSDLASVEQVLSDSGRALRQADLLIAFADSLLPYVAPEKKARANLAATWDTALNTLIDANKLSRSDSLDALDARIVMWRAIGASVPLSKEQQAFVLAEASRVVAATTDRFERQAVVPSAAHVLASAGLVAESDAMLKSELHRAVAPYYHMLGLASNAKLRGDKRAALQWYERAWRSSEGAATRLQWGTGFVRELIDLAPDESQRIFSATSAVIGALDAKPETFYGRNERSLKKMASKLVTWQAADPLRLRKDADLRSQLTAKCRPLPERDQGKVNCLAVFAQKS